MSTRTRSLLCALALLLAPSAPAGIVTFPSPAQVVLHEGSASGGKLDIVFFAEGYRLSEMTRFRNDALACMAALRETTPFAENWSRMRVSIVRSVSVVSGITEFGQPIRNTAFGATINERYVEISDLVAFAVARSRAPGCDLPVVLVNTTQYGGGGPFGGGAGLPVGIAKATASSSMTRVVVHEIGHTFAYLQEEYETSTSVPPPPGFELHPNLTFETSPALLKWRHLISPGTPLPTPETVSSTPASSRGIGLFSGAGGHLPGEAQALIDARFRPHLSCKMRDQGNEFCAVCQEAIALRLFGPGRAAPRPPFRVDSFRLHDNGPLAASPTVEWRFLSCLTPVTRYRVVVRNLTRKTVRVHYTFAPRYRIRSTDGLRGDELTILVRGENPAGNGSYGSHRFRIGGTMVLGSR